MIFEKLRRPSSVDHWRLAPAIKNTLELVEQGLIWNAARESVVLRKTFRASVADPTRPQSQPPLDRETGRAADLVSRYQGSVTGVRVGTVPLPSMLLALADGASVLQRGNRAAA